MRYDDRLDTILHMPDTDASARSAAWAQLVDIAAQSGNELPRSRLTAILERLYAWRDSVPESRRRLSSVSLAGRSIPPELALYFGRDKPGVAAPLLTSIRLDARAWQAILPELPPASRALLRDRDDVVPSVRQALESYGPSDFILPGQGSSQKPVDLAAHGPLFPSASAPSGQHGASIQISELVARIEAYRQSHALPIAGEESLPLVVRAEDFRFETAADGLIDWVDGAPSAPIIGLSIADMAEARSAGADGVAAGAFRQRNRFRDARLQVAGEGPSGGQWLISADPVFDPETGRFAGYRGVGRRPWPDERAERSRISPFGDGIGPDSIRQLVHELRTPLNAVRGFAEMIDGQILGPVSTPYRQRAAMIVDDANRLLATFDDLETAAKLESSAFTALTEHVATPCIPLVRALVGDAARMAAARGVALSASVTTGACRVRVDPVTVERMVSRLIAALVGVASRGEILTISIGQPHAMVEILLDLPAALRGVPQTDLLDPGYGPEGDWPDAPALGLGFAMRLVANMAREVGGLLVVNPGQLALTIPTATDSAGETQGRGG